jgi:hypothetical protein
MKLERTFPEQEPTAGSPLNEPSYRAEIEPIEP